jgi:hypothetical protein
MNWCLHDPFPFHNLYVLHMSDSACVFYRRLDPDGLLIDTPYTIDSVLLAL